MLQERLVEIAKRNLANHREGTVDQADGIFTVPATNYFDTERWQAEMDLVFKRLPLVMGFSAELPTPGSYKALDAAGVPVLLSRDADGTLGAFVNMCSHRGAVIVENGTGEARRFTCPYHAWNYDSSGALVGIMDRDDFGDVDPSCNGLTRLPVAERAGIIWATLGGEEAIDIDTYLQGYDELLAVLELDRCHPVGTNVIEGPNWKVAYDGYLDIYHLPILHKNTFGPDFPNKATYDSWGPHQMVTSPSDRAAAYEDLPTEEWPTRALVGGVITIFPHISIATFDAGGTIYMVSQLFPGADPNTSVTIQNFLTKDEPTEDRMEAIKTQMQFLEHVVRDEDYFTGNRIQKAARTGAKDVFMFGRNEGGGQRFHTFVDRLLETEDADLPALFKAPIG